MSLQQQLISLKQVDLAKSANQVLQRSNKAQRQESYKQALLELNQAFEDHLLQAVMLAFGLNAGQAKKVRYKKDRVRVFKQHNIDYTAIDGAETAQILSWIAQSIVYEDAIVTHDLDNAFPFWKEGFPMVQFDNTYTILLEDIQIHYEMVLDALIELHA